MKLLVKRTDHSAISTIGELLIDGEHFCWTLEPPNPIPLGVYELTIRYSKKFADVSHAQMPHVENVPGHTGILIHWGNWARDTKDCLLVGGTKAPLVNFIGESKKAFDALFARLLEAAEPITITYTEG